VHLRLRHRESVVVRLGAANPTLTLTHARAQGHGGVWRVHLLLQALQRVALLLLLLLPLLVARSAASSSCDVMCSSTGRLAALCLRVLAAAAVTARLPPLGLLPVAFSTEVVLLLAC
jgi:hypothetical protein